MSTDAILMAHVMFGLLCIIAGLWVFVDTLNANESNLSRIRGFSFATAVFMWLAFFIGGYWYVYYYAPDKAFVLKGPWPFAHDFFMEMKEHVLFILLLLATFLPIAASNNLVTNKSARTLVLTVAGLIVLIGIVVDGSGGIIAMGAKLGAMAKQGG